MSETGSSDWLLVKGGLVYGVLNGLLLMVMAATRLTMADMVGIRFLGAAMLMLLTLGAGFGIILAALAQVSTIPRPFRHHKLALFLVSMITLGSLNTIVAIHEVITFSD